MEMAFKFVRLCNQIVAAKNKDILVSCALEFVILLALIHGGPFFSKKSKWWTSSKIGQGNFLCLISRERVKFFQSVFGFEFDILLALIHGRPLLSKKSKWWTSSKWRTREFSMFDISRTDKVFSNPSSDLSLLFYWL
jgi:hypothetical protein